MVMIGTFIFMVTGAAASFFIIRFVATDPILHEIGTHCVLILPSVRVPYVIRFVNY